MHPRQSDRHHGDTAVLEGMTEYIVALTGRTTNPPQWRNRT